MASGIGHIEFTIYIKDLRLRDTFLPCLMKMINVHIRSKTKIVCRQHVIHKLL